MPYKVTIHKIETKTINHQEWTTVDERLFTDDERSHLSLAQGMEYPIKRIYGYTPGLEKEETVSTEIYSGLVQEINVLKVVKAVHGLEGQ
jgi:hypothetical protein